MAYNGRRDNPMGVIDGRRGQWPFPRKEKGKVVTKIHGGIHHPDVIKLIEEPGQIIGCHDDEFSTEYWDGLQWRDLYEPVQGLDYRNCPNCSQMYPLEEFVGGCPRCGAPFVVKDG